MLIQIKPGLLTIPFDNDSLLKLTLKYEKLNLVELLLAQKTNLNDGECMRSERYVQLYSHETKRQTPLLYDLSNLFLGRKKDQQLWTQFAHLLLKNGADSTVEGHCFVEMGNKHGQDGITNCLFSPKALCQFQVAQLAELFSEDVRGESGSL